jgi:hypothetical protein
MSAMDTAVISAVATAVKIAAVAAVARAAISVVATGDISALGFYFGDGGDPRSGHCSDLLWPQRPSLWCIRQTSLSVQSIHSIDPLNESVQSKCPILATFLFNQSMQIVQSGR